MEAGRMNPGPWTDHSISTAVNAEIIAKRCEGIDPEAAYIMGLLHDIGRRVGVCYIKHVIEGYRYLMEQGYADVAVICLTHSFTIPTIDAFMGRVDVSDEDYQFVKQFVETHTYDDYDRLIQLCDSVSLAGGGILIEKRLLDVGLRYGVSDAQIDKWRATLALKDEFDRRVGEDIYKLLPNIVNNTFGW